MFENIPTLFGFDVRDTFFYCSDGINCKIAPIDNVIIGSVENFCASVVTRTSVALTKQLERRTAQGL